jgi:hypothetical protein
MKMEQTECSETLAYKIQMPGNYPEESIQKELLVYRDSDNADLLCSDTELLKVP